ncbi:hypothetical protein ARMGADRAFT_1073045 [Armillaria gallica]|uniref:DDE-1 domain-containing protein n=1 Tax=Armillaria gallica TaxID=47427 RepID=A0A2H3DZT8_ARMGA|nr:hypothetical protein ARMGADRAFT_1073045 [Armillaria gallica]
MPSPQKKRVKVSISTPVAIPFSVNIANIPKDDTAMTRGLSPTLPSKIKSNLMHYWQKETAAERAEHCRREFDKAWKISEEHRKIAEEEKKAAKEASLASSQERSKRHYDKMREKKIEEGWVPACGNFSNYKKRLNGIDDTRWPWRSSDIAREVKKLNAKAFEKLAEQVVGRWIDRKATTETGKLVWTEVTLKNIAAGNWLGGHTTRFSILVSYPDLQKEIEDTLESMRDVRVTLTMITIRAIMISLMECSAPELFTVSHYGSTFKCSESFVRKFLCNVMGWSERRVTKCAQKLPEDYKEILTNAFLREAHIIHDYAIPPELHVNTDQTQVVYQQGTNKTWTKKGVKQVATVGHEEKRAFTLVLSISASGNVLPMQAIYSGGSNRSCPSKDAPMYGEAMQLGIRFLPSKMKTYWSTQDTMRSLVTDILVPYYNDTKARLGLPTSQHSKWKIDCWSVHKSVEFRDWMQENHSNIIVIYVSGGTTGLWQPLDVGIQRPLKLSIKKTSHHDIVSDVMKQLENGTDPKKIQVNTSVGVLRDRSVGWIVNAIRDVSDKEFVKKAWELCCIDNLNTSQASLTSADALAQLRSLLETNPTFHKELTKGSHDSRDSGIEELPFSDIIDDDSDVSVMVIQKLLVGDKGIGNTFALQDDRSIT